MNDIESRIHRGMKQLAPDVFQNVLADNSPRLESEVWLAQDPCGQTKNFWGRAARTAALLAACCVLILGLGMYQMFLKVDSVVEIDVNPSLELQVNRSDRVVRLNALNADGVKILDTVGDDLKHAKLDEAVCVLVDAMVTDGYLDEKSSSVLVSVEHGNEARSEKLQLMVAGNVKKTLKQDQIKGVVYHQSYEANDTVAEIARSYGISPGKACFIQKLILKRPDFTIEELAALSISEITELLQRESVEMSEYIAKKPVENQEERTEEEPSSSEELYLARNDEADFGITNTAYGIKPDRFQPMAENKESLKGPAGNPALSPDGAIMDTKTEGELGDNSFANGGAGQDIPEVTPVLPDLENPDNDPQNPGGEAPGTNPGTDTGGPNKIPGITDKPAEEVPGDSSSMNAGQKPGQVASWESLEGMPEALCTELKALTGQVDTLLASISNMEPLESAGGAQHAYNTCMTMLNQAHRAVNESQALATDLYTKGSLEMECYVRCQNITKTAEIKLLAAADYLDAYGKTAGILK